MDKVELSRSIIMMLMNQVPMQNFLFRFCMTHNQCEGCVGIYGKKWKDGKEVFYIQSATDCDLIIEYTDKNEFLLHLISSLYEITEESTEYSIYGGIE